MALAKSVAGLSEGFLESVLGRGTVVPFRTDLLRLEDFLDGFVFAIVTVWLSVWLIRGNGRLRAACALPEPIKDVVILKFTLLIDKAAAKPEEAQETLK